MKQLLTATIVPPMMKTLPHKDMRYYLKTNPYADMSILGERFK